MKRIFSLILAVAFCLMLCACGTTGSNDDSNNNGADNEKNAVKTSDLSIDDFEWETKRTKYNGADCYAFSLTNNSEYDIIAVEFTYKVKDEVADTDLVAYDAFMKGHDGYIEEDDSPRDVILRGNKNALVAQGEQLTGLRFTVGFKNWAWYDYPTEEQFGLMEPKEMQIGVIGKNSVLYIAYYNFENDTWTLDENTKAVDTWSEKEIAKTIIKPEQGRHIVATDEEDKFIVDVFGIKKEVYSQYIDSLKAAGFDEEMNSTSYFTGKNADGYVVELRYTSADERLHIIVEKE